MTITRGHKRQASIEVRTPSPLRSTRRCESKVESASSNEFDSRVRSAGENRSTSAQGPVLSSIDHQVDHVGGFEGADESPRV